jgi:predicted metal-binding membrane protein
MPAGTMAAGWAIMLVAMMLPVLSAPVRHVIQRSLAARRVRAVALFVAGYAALWLAAGVPLVAVSLAARSSASPLTAAGLVALGVLVWQASPLKQVCLNRLHGHPALAAFGLAADVDALRFGLWHGFWCVGSCFGVMLLPMLFPSLHLLGMVLASFWMWGEQLERPALPSWRWRVPLKALRLVVFQLQQRLRGPRGAGSAQHAARS